MFLHHYGFATSDLNSSLKTYSLLGYTIVSDIAVDLLQDVKIIFIQKDDGPLIELIEPLSTRSPVSHIIKKNGPCLYHTGYLVKDINNSIRELRKEEFIMISKLVAATAFDGKLICFLFHKNIGLIELIQESL